MPIEMLLRNSPLSILRDPATDRLRWLGRPQSAAFCLHTLALALVCFVAPASAQEKLQQSSCSADPRYPEPKEPGQVFYLQRSGNPNTVIYAVNLDANGSIDTTDPVRVYWRRYNDQGETKKLTFTERRLAYGVKYRASPQNPASYIASLVSLPSLKVVVEQLRSGKVRASLPISGTPAQLVCVYVEWKKRLGIIPKILHIDIVGNDLSSGQRLVERIRP